MPPERSDMTDQPSGAPPAQDDNRARKPLGGPYTFLWQSSWSTLVLQVVLVTLVLFTALPAPRGLSQEGFRAIAVFITCFGLWVTAALPFAVTGLLAISLLSLFRVFTPTEAFGLFGNTAVFFILGSFMLAAALMRSGLSKRIALVILSRCGASAGGLLTGVFAIAWCLSLIMSEHAVAAVLFPVILEILRAAQERGPDRTFAKGLLLALAWGAIIGGTGTLLGGARAPLALGILHRLTGEQVSFLQWSRVTMPVTVAMGLVALPVLQLLFGRGRTDVVAARARLTEETAQLGPLTRREKGTGLIFLVTIFCWVFLSRQIDLATTAILASVALFVFRLISWSDTEEYVNWEIILMYGGAVALGTALSETGAAAWLAQTFLPWGAPFLLMIGLLVLLSALLTEGMSSAAVVAFLLPLAIGFAEPLGLAPRHLAYLIAVAAGLVYIFPMGAPPLAIVYSSGMLRLREVILPGIILHLVSWTVILLWVHFFWPWAGLR
ncbi:MAG: DASS family sodium-coupled anion symporter [Candidatus Eisenbacteria bacterium]|nr:DASS family sodium-coupled anion symporter [Candidatus Eisenbacteria bacterium]